MDVSIRYFAGEERPFRFSLGGYSDLEKAAGASIGTLYKRFGLTEFSVDDVRHTLIVGLIGGGLDYQSAKALVSNEFEVKPALELAALASDVFISAMTGIDPDASEKNGVDRPLDIGAILHSLIKVGLSPDQVRNMRYADFVAIMNAAEQKTDPPSEEEYHEMMARWEGSQNE